MKKKIAPAAILALKEALTSVYWYKLKTDALIHKVLAIQ
jgi:hypothetical protein